VVKAATGRVDEINTCIGCNQACLDHTFPNQRASCLVNLRACHETELKYTKTGKPHKIAVVGAGPAGLSATAFHKIGGAVLAAELDAKRAIREGAELAARL
jgi:NADPH-dependent 2,4-dienoyl-CoA reductase/sulfur reductase-like enzyme